MNYIFQCCIKIFNRMAWNLRNKKSKDSSGGYLYAIEIKIMNTNNDSLIQKSLKIPKLNVIKDQKTGMYHYLTEYRASMEEIVKEQQKLNYMGIRNTSIVIILDPKTLQ